MKKIYTLCLFLFPLLSPVFSQTQDPCGTMMGRSKWLQHYQAHPQEFRKGMDTVLWIPHSIHLVGSDAGEGYFSAMKLVDALCTLNNDYEASDMQFFIAGDLHYVANTAWNIHDHVLDGYEMMVANDIPGTLNSYLVSDPSGYCGYNLPYASLCVNKSCASAGDHTWAHEIGHAFSLPHPFLGWENIDYSYSTPTPLENTSDAYTFFQDTVVLDTTASILETHLVELMDSSNCSIAADGFCDTRPDYISYRWPCNASNFSLLKQKDPNNVDFYSDGTLIMSYSYDECSSRFSDEQTAAMRANILEESPEWISNVPLQPFITNATYTAIAPQIDVIIPAVPVHFEWLPVPNATHYVFQITRYASFASLEQEFLLTTNSIDLDNLLPEKHYKWRVKAFNANSFCAPVSTTFTFETAAASAVTDPTLALRVFPTLLEDGEITVEATGDMPFQGEIALVDAFGKIVWQGYNLNFSKFNIPVTGCSPGLYFLTMGTGGSISKTYRICIIP